MCSRVETGGDEIGCIKNESIPEACRAEAVWRTHLSEIGKGVDEPASIGKAMSSGCIRMMNEDVIDLYERVPVGTPVIVLPINQMALAG